MDGNKFIVEIEEKNNKPQAYIKMKFNKKFKAIFSPEIEMIIGESWEVEVIGQKGRGQNVVYTVKPLVRRDRRLVTDLGDHWVDPETLTVVQAWLFGGIHVMLKGPPGCGKTSMTAEIAKAHDMNYLKLDCGLRETPSAWFGYEAAKDGSTIFMPSDLVALLRQAKAKKNQTFLVAWDEINRVPPEILGGLLGIFDHTKTIQHMTSEGINKVESPINVLHIATVNEGPEHLDTFPLGAALKDRFMSLHIDFPPVNVEAEILFKRRAIELDQAELIVRVADSIRKAKKDRKFAGRAPSIRATEACAQLSKYLPLKTAIIRSFLEDCHGDLTLDENGDPKDSNTEKAKAYSHIRAFMKEVGINGNGA